jgi:hypothetical protein
MNAMSQTDIVGACGDKSLIHPVMTEIALLGDAFVLIKHNGIIRACIHAGLAPGAQIVIHDDNIVLSFDDGFFRTGLNAGGIVTVPTHVDLKNQIRFSGNELR